MIHVIGSLNTKMPYQKVCN